MLKRIFEELRHHAPFTIFGAVIGMLVMVPFQKIPSGTAYNIFYILHPMHVVLSALVTSSMYSIYRCGRSARKGSLFILLVIGYIGAIGVATLSDSLIPYLGETILSMPYREAHIGFIEKWWLINPLALLGIAIAYLRPSTKFPHAAHVFISTSASLFHIIMAMGSGLSPWSYIAIFFFLFIAVWVPCCVSDIVFPLLFVNKNHA